MFDNGTHFLDELNGIIISAFRIECSSEMDETENANLQILISKKFYSSITYPMRLYQFIGCAPFIFTENGIEVSVLKYLLTVIQDIFVCSVFIFVHTKRIMRGNIAGGERDLQLHALFNMTLLLLCITVTWIEAAMRVEKWSRLLKEILRIDQELAKNNILLGYGYGMRWSLGILAGQLVCPNLVFIFLETDVDYAELFFIYCVPHFTICITGYVYYEIVHLIEMRLTKLNYLLKTLAKPNYKIFTMTTNNDEKSFDLLCQICTWHHTLVKSIKLMNKTFGFRMVSLFIFSFDILAMHAFLISRYFKMEISVIHLPEYVTLFSCYAITVYIICKHCEYSVQEVKKTGSLLHQINTSDKDMIDEIAMFSFQILNDEVAFSGAGFFEINFCLLFSIIGGVTTYTIILIQLQMDGPQNGSISTQNFTEIMTIQNVSDFENL